MNFNINCFKFYISDLINVNSHRLNMAAPIDHCFAVLGQETMEECLSVLTYTCQEMQKHRLVVYNGICLL